MFPASSFPPEEYGGDTRPSASKCRNLARKKPKLPPLLHHPELLLYRGSEVEIKCLMDHTHSIFDKASFCRSVRYLRNTFNQISWKHFSPPALAQDQIRHWFTLCAFSRVRLCIQWLIKVWSKSLEVNDKLEPELFESITLLWFCTSIARNKMLCHWPCKLKKGSRVKLLTPSPPSLSGCETTVSHFVDFWVYKHRCLSSIRGDLEEHRD